MMLTQEKKKEVAELLALLFDDNEFIAQYHKINETTVRETEELVQKLMACNEASAALLAGVKCVPKSKGVYGWIISCVPALLDVYRTHKDALYTNMLCTIGIRSHLSEIKLTMIR